MRAALVVLALVVVAACAGDQGRADSLAAAARADSAAAAQRVAADSARRADSVRAADSVANAAAATPSMPVRRLPPQTLPRPRAADSVKLSPNIGRDSVTRRPRRIPADTQP